jgi:hypothetical protein
MPDIWASKSLVSNVELNLILIFISLICLLRNRPQFPSSTSVSSSENDLHVQSFVKQCYFNRLCRNLPLRGSCARLLLLWILAFSRQVSLLTRLAPVRICYAQCCGSGSSWILLSPSQKSQKNLDSYWLCDFFLTFYL